MPGTTSFGVSKLKGKEKEFLLEKAKKRKATMSIEPLKKVACTSKSTPDRTRKDDEPAVIDFQVLEALPEHLLIPFIYVIETMTKSSWSEIKEHEGVKALCYAVSTNIIVKLSYNLYRIIFIFVCLN